MNKRFFSLTLICLLLFFFIFNFCTKSEKEKVIIEISKPKVHAEGLGTMAYVPTSKETPFLKKILNKKEFSAETKWKDHSINLSQRTSEYISWFGIVREIKKDKKKNTSELLIEMKYFDGLTDFHLQVISLYGAGDFKILIPGMTSNIPRLSLIRVYGTVMNEENGIPIISPEYIRVWKWGLFTFMDYGKDKSNPKWIKIRNIKYQRIYSSRPDKKYYEDRLGKREKTDQRPLFKTEMFDTYFYDRFISFNFNLEESLNPIIKLIKKKEYIKALEQLNKLEPIWKNDKRRTHIWLHFYLYQTKIYLGLKKKDKAINSLLHCLKHHKVGFEDQYMIWGFLYELGYKAPKEKANEVLGCIIETSFLLEELKAKINLTVYKDTVINLVKSSNNQSSSLGLSNWDSRKFKNEVKAIINKAQDISHIFSLLKEPFRLPSQEFLKAFSIDQSNNPIPIIKFFIFTPEGKKEYKIHATKIKENQELFKLYSLAIDLAKKVNKENESKKRY